MTSLTRGSNRQAETWRRAEASPFAPGLQRIGEASSMVRLAWRLRDNVDLGAYADAGTVRVLVRNRTLRAPGRAVRRNGNDDVPDSGTAVPQPGAIHAARRTRLDIDAAALAGAGRKRLQIRVILAEGLEFFPAAWDIPAITAKSEAAATRLVNLKTGVITGRNLHYASFWALSEAGGTPVADEYNIAVVAIDEDDKAFALPVIIDPPIRNRA